MSESHSDSADDYLPISALQHLVFCERQCALIHVERLWVDNRLTVEGTQLHKRVDEATVETRRDVRTVRGLRLVSHSLRLVGRADVVEFSATGDQSICDMENPLRAPGRLKVRPVEYKRGRPKQDRSDEVQLCAQAMCIEEMLGVPIEWGALYYARRRQRTEVRLDSVLRELTEGFARRLHDLVAAGVTPRVGKQPKCQRCSMFGICLPHGTAPESSASDYFDRALRQVVG